MSLESQLNELINKNDDLIHKPDQLYSLLARHDLLTTDHGVDENRPPQPQPKFLAVFDYLLESAQVYGILKSMWQLNVENTSIISDCSLKTVLDWSWSRVTKIKTELNNLRKNLAAQISPVGRIPIDAEQLSTFLARQNSLLDSLIQIYKQFLKMNASTSREGIAQLNKKLCIVESIKFYVEHLILFHKFDMLIAPPSPPASQQQQQQQQDVISTPNYLSDMQINFKIIENRWAKRRQEQVELENAITSNSSSHSSETADDSSDIVYPFTYMIDCLFEECRSYANVASFFFTPHQHEHHQSIGEVTRVGYPPKSLIDLLDICLECNIGTKMKQIIILYVLCDLMHTEYSSSGQRHILKLINAYCSNTFTIMSTQLDSVLSVPWSTSATSIVSLGSDGQDPNNSSCLFDLVNGIYLIDARIPDKAFKYLKATDLNYLEFYEKYFILYDTMSVGESHEIASQYLWLFQKLNVSSLVSSSVELNSGSSEAENELGLFKLVSKAPLSVSSSSSSSSFNDFNKLKHEQRMHSRLIITIYLANQSVKEAYALVKPHLKNVKSVVKNPLLKNHPGVRLSKELITHFFLEVDKYKLWKELKKLTSIDKDLLLMMLNFFEASQKIDLICMAIDVHIDNQNYAKAVELYDQNSKQILASKHNNLQHMVEIAREVHQHEFDEEDDSTYSLLTNQDIKETLNFQYKFTVPLRDLCKNSKRCIHLLNPKDDETYIELLRPAAGATTKEPMTETSLLLHNTTGSILSNKQPIQSSSSTSDMMIGSRSSSRLAVKFATPSHNQSPIEETPHQPITTPVEATRTPTRRSISSVHAIERNDEVTEAKRRKPSTPHPARGVIKFDDQIEEREEQDDGEKTEKEEDDIVKKKHVLFREEKNSRIEEEEEESSACKNNDDDVSTQPTTSTATTTVAAE